MEKLSFVRFIIRWKVRYNFVKLGFLLRLLFSLVFLSVLFGRDSQNLRVYANEKRKAKQNRMQIIRKTNEKKTTDDEENMKSKAILRRRRQMSMTK